MNNRIEHRSHDKKDKKEDRSEKIIYVPCASTSPITPDYLATIDCDTSSESFSKVIHRLEMPYLGDELRRAAWHFESDTKKKFLLLSALNSGRVYVIDVSPEKGRAPILHKIIERNKILEKSDLCHLNTIRSLPTGEILIAAIGDSRGKGTGGFALLDQNFRVKGRWSEEKLPYAYDMWFQPEQNVMVSTELGDPKTLDIGLKISQNKGLSNSLHFWDFKNHKKVHTIDLGCNGTLPLEVRFLHNPHAMEGFVGVGLSSSIVRFYKDSVSDSWKSEVVIKVKSLNVEGWISPKLPGLITDILISMDDRFLYFCNWIHGDVRQYDISDTSHPKLTGQIFVGGSFIKDGPVKVMDESHSEPLIHSVKGTVLRGGPQKLQLSLDGKRLYVTNSPLTPHDEKFYPDLQKKGSHLIMLDVNTEQGGLALNPDFIVDFGSEPGSPSMAHEMRLENGDCTTVLMDYE